jgi:hypothetical protein
VAASTETWSDGALRRYCLYLAAAVASTPAGIVYASFAIHHLERWWTVLLTVVFGVLLANRGWAYVNRRIEALSSLREEFPFQGLDDELLFRVVALVGALVVSERDFRE